MADETEMEENEPEEDEVPFFECKDCGSKRLEFTCTVEVLKTIKKVLPCRCGDGEEAAWRNEWRRVEVEQTGYVRANRHLHIEASDETQELDNGTDDDEIGCEDCYNKYKDRADRWQVRESDSKPEDDDSDLTITCGGCGREIEFGYSHANKQGRIFLGEDDVDFNPWKTFPDPKYVEAWRERGWLRPGT
jgi:hypothetical protein